MASVLSVLFAVLTAVGNATGTVLQRIAARRVPPGDAFSFRLIPHLVHSAAWLGGIAVIVVAAACQALALTLGSMSLVQPILVSELPFTLLIACMVSRRPLPAAGWTAAGMIAVGLGVALAAASPYERHSEVSPAVWALTLVTTGGVMTACVLAALPRPRGMARAALFSSASAIGYALTATLMKFSTTTFEQHGFGAFLACWQTYGFVVAGACALFLLANAMESGPLVASQPALTLGEALVSVALGMLVYGDEVRTGWWLVPEGIGAVMVTWGVLLLPRVKTEEQDTPAT
ncbi:DMT family transporter [Streptomyces albidochromogenes]|uniref:DMT family transporter n=1 Tax=Streptomyces albidochromogenes TaxID=329524 RepID=UPI00110F74EE|nr:DMT family transporter [Streptomyces albidochromogenes]